MRILFWLDFPRASEHPVRDLWTAALGSAGAVAAAVLVLGLLLGGPGAGLAGGYGAALVVGSLLVSWGAMVMVPRGRDQSLPQALLVAYVAKVVLGAVALVLLPLPETWSRGWFLTGALAALAATTATEAWAVARLRIPYFVPVEDTGAPSRRSRRNP